MPGIRVVIALAFAGALGTGNAVAQTPDGAALYSQNCRACRGAAGKELAQLKALDKTLPTIADSAFLGARSDDSLVHVMNDGVGKDMKPFKDKLSPEEMLAIAKYVRG